MRHLAWLPVALLVLGGCRSTPERDAEAGAFLAERQAVFSGLDRWQASGRLAVSDGERGGSANFDWIDAADGYTVRLRRGQGRWVLDATPGFAVLEGTRVGRRSAAEAEVLVSEALGWPVPVTYLRDWLRGLPGTARARTAFADDGSLAALRYDGWEVEYRAFERVADVLLPRRLEATNGPYRVRVVIRDWSLAPEAAKTDAPP